MQKPKLFLIEIMLILLVAVTSSVGVVASGAIVSIWTKCALIASISLGSMYLMISVIRNERQSQRVNRATSKLNNALGDLRSGTGLNASHSAPSGLLMTAANSSKNVGGVQSIASQSTTKLSNSRIEQAFTLLIDPRRSPASFLPIVGNTYHLDIPLCDALEATAIFKVSSDLGQGNQKVGLVVFEALDANGKPIDHQLLPVKSETRGYFKYLLLKDQFSETRVDLRLPRNARSLRIHIQPWEGYAEIQNKVTVKIEATDPNWYSTRQPREIRVAAILDEFSYNCFKYECNLLPLSRDNWKAELDSFQPDLFFCESAWSGPDSKERPWMGKVYASENFDFENRKDLLGILEYCRLRGIPTVFWNKEDPSHYEDRKHDFVKTALLFDSVLTTDVNCVSRYKQDYGVEKVDVLPFAVQPRLFNPIATGTRSTDVVFAGSWYSNHVERSKDMMEMFKTIEASGHKLKIYDRFFGSGDPSHEFPQEFQYAIKPPVPNSEVSAIYKESIFGLTVNTETKSPTMFARRIFEMMACNTFVLSNYSRGVEEHFGNNVIFLDRDPDSLASLSREDIDRKRRENLEFVLSKHTYANRFQRILDLAEIRYSTQHEKEALLIVIDNVDDGGAIFEQLRAFGSWKGPKTMVFSREVAPLDFAEALTEWNCEGIRAVSENLIRDGRTLVSQWASTASHCLVLTAEQFKGGFAKTEAVSRLGLHSQYVSTPVADASQIEGAGHYSFVKTNVNFPVMIESTSFPALLDDWANDEPSLVYVA